jgi:hypothetical protein
MRQLTPGLCCGSFQHTTGTACGKEEKMAIVLVAEVVIGLDDVKETLQQAATTLAAMIEELPPEFGTYLPAALERELLRPLQSRMAFVERLQKALTLTP